MAEKRMISDYEVIHSIDFGSRELVIGEDIDNKDGLYYLVAYGERTELFERYDKCVVGDDYAEIMEIFATRLSEEAQKLRAEHDKLTVPDAMAFIKPGECTPLNYTDNLKGRVIVIKPEVLRPEHRIAVNQLYIATGGNGVYPKARGSAVFCKNIYDGSTTRYERYDVMGTVEREKLPEWAQSKYDGIMEKLNKAKTDKEH